MRLSYLLLFSLVSHKWHLLVLSLDSLQEKLVLLFRLFFSIFKKKIRELKNGRRVLQD